MREYPRWVDLDRICETLKHLCKRDASADDNVEEMLKPYVQIDMLLALCASFKTKKAIVIGIMKYTLTLLCKNNGEDAIDLFFCNLLFLLETEVAQVVPKLFKESCSVLSKIKTPKFLERPTIRQVAQRLEADRTRTKSYFLPISLQSRLGSPVANVLQSVPVFPHLSDYQQYKPVRAGSSGANATMHTVTELLGKPVSPSLFYRQDADAKSAWWPGSPIGESNTSFAGHGIEATSQGSSNSIEITCTGICPFGLDGDLTITASQVQTLRVINGRIRGKLQVLATFKEVAKGRGEPDAISCLSEAAEDFTSSSDDADTSSPGCAVQSHEDTCSQPTSAHTHDCVGTASHDSNRPERNVKAMSAAAALPSILPFASTSDRPSSKSLPLVADTALSGCPKRHLGDRYTTRQLMKAGSYSLGRYSEHGRSSHNLKSSQDRSSKNIDYFDRLSHNSAQSTHKILTGSATREPDSLLKAIGTMLCKITQPEDKSPYIATIRSCEPCLNGVNRVLPSIEHRRKKIVNRNKSADYLTERMQSVPIGETSEGRRTSNDTLRWPRPPSNCQNAPEQIIPAKSTRQKRKSINQLIDTQLMWRDRITKPEVSVPSSSDSATNNSCAPSITPEKPEYLMVQALETLLSTVPASVLEVRTRGAALCTRQLMESPRQVLYHEMAEAPVAIIQEHSSHRSGDEFLNVDHTNLLPISQVSEVKPISLVDSRVQDTPFGTSHILSGYEPISEHELVPCPTIPAVPVDLQANIGEMRISHKTCEIQCDPKNVSEAILSNEHCAHPLEVYPLHTQRSTEGRKFGGSASPDNYVAHEHDSAVDDWMHDRPTTEPCALEKGSITHEETNPPPRLTAKVVLAAESMMKWVPGESTFKAALVSVGDDDSPAINFTRTRIYTEDERSHSLCPSLSTLSQELSPPVLQEASKASDKISPGQVIDEITANDLSKSNSIDDGLKIGSSMLKSLRTNSRQAIEPTEAAAEVSRPVSSSDTSSSALENDSIHETPEQRYSEHMASMQVKKLMASREPPFVGDQSLPRISANQISASSANRPSPVSHRLISHDDESDRFQTPIPCRSHRVADKEPISKSPADNNSSTTVGDPRRVNTNIGGSRTSDSRVILPSAYRSNKFGDCPKTSVFRSRFTRSSPRGSLYPTATTASCDSARLRERCSEDLAKRILKAIIKTLGPASALKTMGYTAQRPSASRSGSETQNSRFKLTPIIELISEYEADPDYLQSLWNCENRGDWCIIIGCLTESVRLVRRRRATLENDLHPFMEAVCRCVHNNRTAIVRLALQVIEKLFDDETDPSTSGIPASVCDLCCHTCLAKCAESGNLFLGELAQNTLKVVLKGSATAVLISCISARLSHAGLERERLILLRAAATVVKSHVGGSEGLTASADARFWKPLVAQVQKISTLRTVSSEIVVLCREILAIKGSSSNQPGSTSDVR